jgi:hypothetical protein
VQYENVKFTHTVNFVFVGLCCVPAWLGASAQCAYHTGRTEMRQAANSENKATYLFLRGDVMHPVERSFSPFTNACHVGKQTEGGQRIAQFVVTRQCGLIQRFEAL